MVKKSSKRQIHVGGIEISRRARQLVLQALKSNRLSYGPFHQKFEQGFARAHHARHAIFTVSGTCALQIALHTLKSIHGWKDNDEVIVPALTFIATSNIVLANRMKPVFVDVDPRTYNIDPSLIERAVTPKTRCIILVHLLGLPADMDPILKIAKKYQLKIIEDSCETMFAKYKNKTVGSIGDIGCFSTYTAHFIVTGVGGIATTNNPAYHIKMRSLMNHGRDSIYLSIDDDEGARGSKLKEIVSRRFRFEDVGYSYRCTEMEAALGIAQLEDKDMIIKKRRWVAQYLNKHLRPLADKLQLPEEPDDRDHVFMLYGITVKKEPKFRLINFLEERGIETRDLFPLLNQPVMRKLFGKSIENRFPVAKFLNRHAFYIGCHQYLSKEDLDYVVKIFYDYFNQKRH